MTGPAGVNTFASAPALTLETGETVTCAATTMTTMTREAGEPVQVGSATQTAWWTFTPSTTGSYVFDTLLSPAGSDTVVAVYTGSAVNALTLVDYNDDEDGPTSLTKLEVTLTAGVTYRIQAHPYSNGGANSITLRVHLIVVNGPVGSDSFSGAPALVLDPDGSLVCAATDMTTKTLEAGETTPAGGSATQTAWWTLTPDERAVYRFDTELSPSGADTVLGVYTGSAVNALTLVDYDDDGGSVGSTSSLSVLLEAGVTYRVQASPYDNGGANSIVLRSTFVNVVPDAPANDDRADAAEITVGDVLTVDAAGATTEPSESGDYHTAWWFFDPPADGWFTVDATGSLRNFEDSWTLQLTVWTESSPGVLRASPIVTSYDDIPDLLQTIYGYADVRYWIQLGSPYSDYNPLSYTLALTTSVVTAIPPPRPDAPPPDNNDFASAEAVTFGGTATAKTSSNATLETGETTNGIKSVWFTYTATTTGKIGIDTMLTPTPSDAQPRTYVYVATGTSPGTLTYVATNFGSNYGLAPNGTTAMDVDVTAGTTYRIRVASAPGALDMDYVLRIGPPFHTTLPWQTGDDITTVWSMPPGSDFGPAHHTPTDGAGINWGGTQGFSYESKKTLSRSFAGPAPGGDMAAINCSWSQSRRLNAGDHYWSPNNCTTWNCTDPYNSSIPGGPGTCPAMPTTSPDSRKNYGDAPVGFHYHSSLPGIGGLGSEVYFRLFGQVHSISLHTLSDRLALYSEEDLEDQAQEYVDALEDAGYTDIHLEWEPEEDFHPQILSMEVAADEPTDADAIVGAGASVTTEWYMKQPEVLPSGTPHTGWGPYATSGTSLVGGEPYVSVGAGVTGNAAGPESWTAGAELLQSYSGGTSSWVSLDSDLLEEVWDWEESQPRGTYQEPSIWYGLTLVALPAGAQSDTLPSMLGPYGTAADFNRYAYRAYQFMALRTMSTGRRFRVTAIPPSEECIGLKNAERSSCINWLGEDYEWRTLQLVAGVRV